MKQKRYFRTIVCLVLGAVLLTGSALANYENASGYTKLKNGMLNMMTVENFSADGKLTLTYDGTEQQSQQLEYKYDRKGTTSEYSKSLDSNGSNEQWIQDGFSISHYNDSYSVYSNDNNKGFNDSYLNGTEEDKSMTDKMVNFAELLCDTLVGDLKNNFVLVSTEGGISTYQIDLSREQIPELIQSGLGLMIGQRSNYSYITFENYDMEDMTEEEWATLHEEADKVFEEHDYNGVVYVREDGTIEHYTTEAEYYKAVGYSNDTASLDPLYYLFDNDPSIGGVSCTVSLDSNGMLSDVKASATFTGKDADGNDHSLVVELTLSIYDYGTTSIEAFDKSLLNFNWAVDEDYHYYQFDSEGNIIEYDKYQYDEYGNIISEDGEAAESDAADEGNAEDSPEVEDTDTDSGATE